MAGVAYGPLSTKQQALPEDEGGLNRIKNRIRAMGQGASFGTTDELEAALTGQDISKIRKEIEQYQRQNFWENLLMETIGGIPTGGVLKKALTTVAPKVFKKANDFKELVKESAASGALYGAGSGEGDLVDRAKNAVVQGTQAGLIGAPIVAGVAKTAGITGNVAKKILGFGNLEKDAANLVKQTAHADIPTPVSPSYVRNAKGKLVPQDPVLQDILNLSREEIDTLARMGVTPTSRTPMTADVLGKNTKGLLSGASSQPGPAAAQAAETAAQTKGNLQEWLESILRTAVMDPAHPHYKTMRNLKNTKLSDVEPLYQQAFQNTTPLISRDLMEEASRLKEFPSVFDNALKLASLDKIKYPSMWEIDPTKVADKLLTGKTRAIPGTNQVEHEFITPDIRFWDMMKRSLYEEAQNKPAMAPKLNEVRRNIMNILDTHPDVDPIYRQARQLYTHASDVERATEAGKRFKTMKPDEFEETLKGFSSLAERENFLGAAVNELIAEATKTSGSAKTAISQLTGPQGSEKLRMMTNTPQEYNDVMHSLKSIENYAELANIMSRPTSTRLGSDSSMQEVLQTIGAGAGITSGAGLTQIQNALSRAMKGYDAASKEKLAQYVLEMLTNPPTHTIPRITELTKPTLIDKTGAVARRLLPNEIGIATGLESPSYYQPETEDGRE